MTPAVLLAAAAAVLLTPALAAADVGQRGSSYAPVVAPTAEKPQSKLWFHDGAWWGSMLNPATVNYEIHRLDDGQWASTGVTLDTRRTSKADVLAAGDRLYVASAGPSPTTASHGPRVWRYSYDRSARTYRLDQGFPVAVTGGGTEAVVIDRDSAGTLWLTYTRDSTVFVAHSTSSDAQWTSPYPLPTPAATGLDPDDISSIVAYDDHVGVMWSNQADDTMYFAHHRDGDGDQVWTTTVAARDPRIADDHISLKALGSDPAGRVFAATKTSRTAGGDPLVLLLVLGTDGQWQRHTVATAAEDHTRPIVMIDGANRRVYVLMSSPCCSGGTIYSKDSDLDRIEFAQGTGTAFIQLDSDPNLNNPASTKQVLDGTTGLVAIAGDDRTRHYGWNRLELGGTAPDLEPPETTIESGPSDPTTSASAAFAFSASEPGSTFECSLDGGGWHGCSSPTGYEGLAEGQHAFEVRASDAAGNVDPTPASYTWTIVPATRALFSDGFESGDFSRWDVVATGAGGSATVQSQLTAAGSYAARLAAPDSAGSHAYARTTWTDPVAELDLSGEFYFEAQGDKRERLPLFRLYGSGAAPLLGIERENKPPNRIFVSQGGSTHNTGGRLALGAWGRLELALAHGTLTVALDGSQVYAGSAANMAGIRTVQIGNDTAGQAFQLVVDEVAASGR